MDADGAPLPADVRLCGYLRKQKSQHRRYFVLRGASGRGPARLECYDSEKKFRAGGAGARPRRAFPVASALSISKRADARHRHLLVLCARDGALGLAADDAEQQQAWYAALVELQRKGQASPDGDGDSALPGPAFREVWQVSLRPRGLGHTKHLAGTYLLCLTDKTISFVKLNAEVADVVLQLLNVRRCGHSENYFFMEVGRSAVTGPGELWMQVDDLVVAQNMHETILEAMKALSEEFRVRSKSQALASTPISVPPRHPPLGTPPPPGQAAFPWGPRPEGAPALSKSPGPPRQKGAGLQTPGSSSDYSTVSSDEGGSSPGDSRPPNTPDWLSYLGAEGAQLDYISMGKLALPEGRGLVKWGRGLEANKRASLPPLALEKEGLPQRNRTLKPVSASASYPEGLNRSADPGYMAMLPGVARSAEGQVYLHMTPGSVSPPLESGGGYMLMSPSGSGSPDRAGQWGPGGRGDYMNMSPRSGSASSTPPEHCPLLAPPGAAPFYSLPRSYRHGARPFSFPFNPGRLSSSSSASSDSLEESAGASCSVRPPSRLLVGGRATPAAPRSAGEYVRIERGPGCLRLVPAEGGEGAVPAGEGAPPPMPRLGGAGAPGGQQASLDAERNGVQPREVETEPGLNYIDLDLVKEAGAEGAPTPRAAAAPSPGGALHTYASIAFHRPWEPHGCPGGPEQAEL